MPPKTGCACESMKPGSSVPPSRSTTSAPRDSSAAPTAAPTAAMRFPLIRTLVPRGANPPPTNTEPLVNRMPLSTAPPLLAVCAVSTPFDIAIVNTYDYGSDALDFRCNQAETRSGQR